MTLRLQSLTLSPFLDLETPGPDHDLETAVLDLESPFLDLENPGLGLDLETAVLEAPVINNMTADDSV